MLDSDICTCFCTDMSAITSQNLQTPLSTPAQAVSGKRLCLLSRLTYRRHNHCCAKTRYRLLSCKTKQVLVYQRGTRTFSRLRDDMAQPQAQVQPCRYKTGKTLGAGSYSVVKECAYYHAHGFHMSVKLANGCYYQVCT